MRRGILKEPLKNEHDEERAGRISLFGTSGPMIQRFPEKEEWVGFFVAFPRGRA